MKIVHKRKLDRFDIVAEQINATKNQIKADRLHINRCMVVIYNNVRKTYLNLSKINQYES